MHLKEDVISKVYNVAIYIRLSKEDESVGESESIKNQRSLLLRYVDENNYNLVDTYIDDGYSGTNFNRPEFIRMISDIEDGKINMVVTKDMSRLGRDYIGTGEYVEKYFPKHNVRYVALTDNIDTYLDTTNNDIAPFKAIMNDYYAKDISKKIRTALRTKQKDGKWVGGCPPFGYMIDEDDKNHLVLCPDEANIVKLIFELASKGMNAYSIKEYLMRNDFPTPSMVRKRKTFQNSLSNTGVWNTRTVQGILQNRIYTGDLVQNRRSKVNYKIKKIKYNPESEWIIVENTHEPLVDKDLFKEIQNMQSKVSCRQEKKTIRLLDGLLYCHECGHKIMICKPRKSDNRTYIACNYYRMNSKLKVCSSHGFNYDYLEEGFLNVLKDIFKRNLDIEKLVNKIEVKCKRIDVITRLEEDILKYQASREQKQSNLDKMYLEKLEGKIAEDMYERIKSSLELEIYSLDNRISSYKKKLLNSQENEFMTSKCRNLVLDFLEHPNIRQLLLKLIDRIEVHENKVVDVYFNFKI